MTESGVALERRPPVRTIAEMKADDAMDDISLLMIAKKTGFGLAPRKWRATLDQIRCLPEVHVRRGDMSDDDSG